MVLYMKDLNLIKLAHIAPSNYTELGIHESDMNMVLAHVAKDNKEYAQLFRGSDKQTLLDNGAFENGVPMSVEDMIEIGHKVGADILVLPDYPYKDWREGWSDYVLEGMEAYKQEGFKTMFIPQSLSGDGVGFMSSLHQAIRHPLVDYVGLSILGCPNAFDHLPSHKVREKIIGEVYELLPKDKLHILGMLDSVDEIERLVYYEDVINSWDTSAAIWYALNDISVEGRTEKFELAVDFDLPVKNFSVSLVLDNINYMKGLRDGNI